MTPRRRRGALPPLPAAVFGVAGPFRVELVADLRDDDGEKVEGLADWYGRRILLDVGLDLACAWLTLRHEWVHMVLTDAGVILPERGADYAIDPEEQVCNALALAMIGEMTQPAVR